MAEQQTADLEFTGASGRLTAPPRDFVLFGQAGGELTARFRVINHSKVALKLEQPGSIPLRRAGALGRSVREAFAGGQGDFVSRLIALGKSLEQEPEITAEASYSADFDSLRPGESGELEVRLRVPPDSGASHDWTVHLPLLGDSIVAVTRITPASKSQD